MVTRIFLLFFFFMFTVSSSLFSKIYYTGKEPVHLINTIEAKNCFISYIIINKKYRYLLKQKKEFKKQLAVVRDALAAYIAKELNIAHQVDIIEFKKEFPGKVIACWPATLHTIARGDTIRKQIGTKYNLLRLRQLWSQASSLNEKGLTKQIIEHMTWHRQLPEIVALDLILGNSDRHSGNLCYDPDTDRFCAIDMDDTLNKDLCIVAYENLKNMMNDDLIIFNKQEIRALIHMKNTLKFLVQKHKPFDLITKLHFFAKKAGFFKGSKMYDERIEKKLLFYEEMITQTHASAHRLIFLIEQMIKRKSLIH
ncbi:MAG TPA: hypothetical protein VLB80_02965 [Candidatus Babeliales bacterium]|nr:hypothetical protein [Candidatus Babeliales bacterium]